MQISARGRIVVWEGASLWVLAAARDEAGTDFHAHHAIQITISLDGGFVIATPHQSMNGPVTAVAADTPHILQTTGAVALLFVEPESPAGRAIAARFFANSSLAKIDAGAFVPLISILRDQFAAGCSAAELIATGREILAAVAVEQAPNLPDRRVRAIIDFVRANLDGPLTLGAAAASVNLSSSRARHLFVMDTGLPFKTFVLWQRLGRAVELYAAGQSLTEAAHEAGFADSAHLSRTFRKTFGIAASLLEVG